MNLDELLNLSVSSSVKWRLNEEKLVKHPALYQAHSQCPNAVVKTEDLKWEVTPDLKHTCAYFSIQHPFLCFFLF